MKKLVAFLLTVTLLFSLSACNLFTPDYEMPEKDFVYDGVRITLTEGFWEDDVYEDGVWYESKSETSVTLDKIGSGSSAAMSVADFMQEMAQELGGSLRTKDGVTFIEDDESLMGFDFTYFYTFYENDGIFWMLTCICDEEDYEVYEPYFIKWSKTVVFE